MDGEDKENYLSNVKNQRDKNSCFDGFARPDLNIVDVLVSSEGSKCSVCNKTKEGSEFKTCAWPPYAIEDGV